MILPQIDLIDLAEHFLAQFYPEGNKQQQDALAI